MTEPTPDELLEDEARATRIPPEFSLDARDLPDDVRDGRIEDADEDDPNAQEQLIVNERED